MNICLVLTLALFADFAMGDIDMCFMENQTKNYELRTFVNHYPEKNHIYFGVKACPEGSLEIAAYFGNYFGIMFGTEGLKTAAVHVRKHINGLPDTVWSSEQVMLNCNEMKYFWMKWSEGELSIGQGLELGSRTLYTFNDVDVRPELYAAFVHIVYRGTAEFENQCAGALKDQLAVHNSYSNRTLIE
ncbi:hypothetical protein CAPTEDRAFT_217148 [Capitella teleta]|uniref:Uncharacterized protein n=1 Tax=Capitella teleta TaxID=283909 RepID=R7VKW8_CAPTE|nr:hypothetical protein CAPTEDRAFT_217148 [Capitella teleta]|eukprot:ELU17125.1 hypothetical protein CAPTEDRAFT_217148 [Capitella teleta]